MNIDNFQAFLEHVIRKALAVQREKFAGDSITDLFLQPNPEEAQFVVLNDEREILNKVTVEEWGGEGIVEEEEIRQVTSILKDIVSKLAQEGAFESLNLQKPFSVVMVNDDFESVADLYYLDDEDVVSLDEDLVKKVDEELGEFFKKLMADF